MTEEREPYVIDSMLRLLLPIRQILHRLITAQDNVTRVALRRDAKALDDAVIDSAFRQRDALFDSAVMRHKAALRDVEKARRIARREYQRAERFLERIARLTEENDDLAIRLEETRPQLDLRDRVVASIVDQYTGDSDG